jgi:transcriptional regulator with XRE-family HTH domain
MRAMLAARKNGIGSSQNLIFGKYRFSLAKELLELSVTQCAARFGVSNNYWLECEKNKRRVDASMLQKIEEDIRDQFFCPL